MTYLMYFFLFCYVSMFTNLPRYIKLSVLNTKEKEKDKEIKLIDDQPQVDTIKEECKPVIKYEDKYENVFRSFTNDYFFTDLEKELEIVKYNEFKTEYENKKRKNIRR